MKIAKTAYLNVRLEENKKKKIQKAAKKEKTTVSKIATKALAEHLAKYFPKI